MVHVVIGSLDAPCLYVNAFYWNYIISIRILSVCLNAKVYFVLNQAFSICNFIRIFANIARDTGANMVLHIIIGCCRANFILLTLALKSPLTLTFFVFLSNMNERRQNQLK